MIFALDKLALSCFRYDSFRGITTTEDRAHNLAKEVEALEKSPERLERMETKLKKISGLFSLIRGFFWLFNIKNYRKDSYLYSAYRATKLFEANIKEFDGEYYDYAYIIGLFKIGLKELEACLEPKYRFIKPYLAYMSQQIERLIDKDPDLPSFILSYEAKVSISSDDIDKLQFKSSPQIADALTTLGLDNQGGLISVGCFKKAYKKAFLRNHPDKHPNREAQFDCVRKAQQQIVNFLKENQSNVIGAKAVINAYLGRASEEDEEFQSEVAYQLTVHGRKLRERLSEAKQAAKEYHELARMRREESEQRYIAAQKSLLKTDHKLAISIENDIRRGLAPRRWRDFYYKFNEDKEAYYKELDRKTPAYREKIHFYDKKAALITQFFKMHVLTKAETKQSSPSLKA